MKHAISNEDLTTTILEFTPLEFETMDQKTIWRVHSPLEFTPLEFETSHARGGFCSRNKLEFTPLEFETYWKDDKRRAKH